MAIVQKVTKKLRAVGTAGIKTKLEKKKKNPGKYFQKESICQAIGNEQVSSVNLAVLCRQS